MSEMTETENSQTPPTETPPTETPPTGETPPSETPPSAEFVPVTPDQLVFPEGAQIDEGLRDEFLTLVNNQELDPAERANNLVALSGKLLDAASEASSAAWEQMQSAWQDEVRNDPDLGGAKFQATMESVGKLVEEYGSPELREVFDITGAGNNVHVVRFLSTIAAQLTESSTHVAGTPNSAPQSFEERVSAMYPSMKK